MREGLLVVDMQNDYFAGGAMELVSIDEAARNCAGLLRAFRERGAPVFHMQHISTGKGSTFFLPHTPGCEIHESVKPLAAEKMLVKHFPSSFRGTELQQELRRAGVTDVVICGAMTHMCIDSTTRAAFDSGYHCTVIADACATRDLVFKGHRISAFDVQAAFMAALGGPFARVISTKEYIGP